MSILLEGSWPYEREQPDLVVLGVEPGRTPSTLPPVRIFLGTEEGQYRAERVFVWSVLQVRDVPAVIDCRSCGSSTTLAVPVFRCACGSTDVTVVAGDAAFRYIERAVQLTQQDKLDAICTAPLNKEALNLAGYHYAGHTELLAELTGIKGTVMMLAHGTMNVSHVTTHVALEDVPKRITPERIRRVIDLTHAAMKRLGKANPKIAIAALNPHAGEGGLFGRQDIDISAPTIAKAVADGLDVVGPVPGDTVFVKLRAGQYDAVVAMYHDQGHIPVKLLGFQVDPVTGKWDALSGVNITLGLPIIRTSVDHGTAFDIAGKGIASETSLIEAIEYAERLAETA